MIQYIIVGTIILLAAFIAARRIHKSFTNPTECDGCDGCKLHEFCDRKNKHG